MDASTLSDEPDTAPLGPPWSWIVPARADELRAMLLGWCCFFCLLAGYAVLRPVRDQIGVAGGAPMLFTLGWYTVAAMLIANPCLAWLLAKWPVRSTIVFTFRMFVVQLMLFYFAHRIEAFAGSTWLGWIFFVWLNVFNLFVVALFWALMVDHFRSEQGKRLFAFLALGGTLGAVTGSLLTSMLVKPLGTANLFFIAGLFLEAAVQCIRQFLREKPADAPQAATTEGDVVVGGSAWSGIGKLLTNPYLAGIAGYMLLFNLGSAWLYYQQAELVRGVYTDKDLRTAFLAQVDLATNTLTVLGELLLTAQLLRRWGVAFTLSLLPLFSVVGFSLVAAQPVLMTLVVFNVLRRAGEFAVAKPAREVLFTVLAREDKFKAKSLVDTFFHRLGDQAGGALFLIYQQVGLTMPVTALITAGASLGWLALAIGLGREQTRRAAASTMPT